MHVLLRNVIGITEIVIHNVFKDVLKNESVITGAIQFVKQMPVTLMEVIVMILVHATKIVHLDG